MNTADVERMLLESLGDHARFANAVDALVGHLLSGVPGYSTRPTDGVLLEHPRISKREATASGVVILIEQQTVEPLRVNLSVTDSGALHRGWVYFGDAARDVVRYGTREHRKLSMEIIANPDRNYAWKESFWRDGDGWHRLAS
jgi:hypothetical protein